MPRSLFRRVVLFAMPIALLFGDIGATAQSRADGAPSLSLPIACKLGETCFIQNYVDVDPGPGIRDYLCGSATYQAHTGTDFRLNSAAQSEMRVGVLAAADGTVKGARDGMADAFPNEASMKAFKGRECGNGVVIDHGDGWETQYCHMRQGSLGVGTGDRVARGQHLGDVGYSGNAEFAHLHLAVRHDGKAVDPFTSRSQDGACTSNASEVHGLWDETVAPVLQYSSGQIFAASFTGAVPVLDQLEGDHTGTEFNKRSEQLIFFARLLNLRAGDRIRLVVRGPAGFDVKSISKPLERNKATYMAYAGKRRTQPSWVAGQYEGWAQLVRGGAVVSEMRSVLELSD